MDWSRSKSIFIFVFLILDLFLYSLYLNRHTEAEKVEILGEETIEAKLRNDNITYVALPNNIDTAAYLSGKVKNFEEASLPPNRNQKVKVENENKLVVTLDKPVKLRNLDDEASYKEFLQSNVSEGASYVLWEIDHENRVATFFQRINERTIYYNINGIVTIYWNEQGEVYLYEQTMLEGLEENEKKENLLSPLQVIQTLYAKQLLKPNSRITQMKLGYSTLVQLTQTQVFVPTWDIRVETEDDNQEEYFVDAVEGKVIDVNLDMVNVEEIEEVENRE